MLKQIFGFLKLLHSETGTNQIAAGIACGFILGMTPSLSLQSIFVFVCIFLFRIQLGAAMLSAFFFAFIAYLLDPLFDNIGAVILSLNALQGIFTTLYNLPIVPFTRFYNTIVMGSGVVSIALAPFLFFVSKWLIAKYREKIVLRFKDSKFWKVVKATSLYQWYYKYEQFYG